MMDGNNKISLIIRIKKIFTQTYDFVTVGIWRRTDHKLGFNIIKTINLSVRSFFDTKLQVRASALTYNTLLAIVPVLALLFAVGKAFNMQDVIKKNLLDTFPAQHTFIEQAIGFVDPYLNSLSSGLFVGVGIVLLLWTMISLLSNVETAFNDIWGISKGRSLMRKITDYTAIFIILPILMICSNGISVYMNSIAKDTFLSPLLTKVLDIAPYILTCLFFTLAYILIPNTKVKFKNAFIAGVICGVSFHVVQWLFLSGQIFVAKNNAVYGGFSFLPLLLIWLQLSWLICLIGSGIAFSSQNFTNYNFESDIDLISIKYMNEVTLFIATIIVKRFQTGVAPYTRREISVKYDIPIKLVNKVIDKLVKADVLIPTMTSVDSVYGYVPAVDADVITFAFVYDKLESLGYHDFLPSLKSSEYEKPFIAIKQSLETLRKCDNNTKIKDINIDIN